MKLRDQLWLLILPPVLYGVSIYTYPFGHTMSEKKIAVSSLNTQQKLNIQKAVSKLDGTVVRPGEQFSFNKVVGPRTTARGYYSAPAYVGANTYSSPGGGICVLSSALYQDLLIAGLKVSQRVPHNRTMQTVEPGLDATVWYGGADLKFVNDTSAPIQIQCKVEDGFLSTAIAGERALEHPNTLARREFEGGNNQISVEVFQNGSDHSSKLVSRDLYLLSSHAHSQHLERSPVNMKAGGGGGGGAAAASASAAPELTWSQPVDAVGSTH